MAEANPVFLAHLHYEHGWSWARIKRVFHAGRFLGISWNELRQRIEAAGERMGYVHET